MHDIEELGRRVFAAQPFTQLMGAQLVSAGRDRVEITLPIEDRIKQHHGFVHGGALSFLADIAITFAGGIALGGDALTAEFKINFVRPAVGSHLVARALAKSVGRRQAVCQCDIFAVKDGQESLCAVGQGTVMPVK